MFKARPKTRAERGGHVPSAWRTTPANRRKLRAGSRLIRASHRPGLKLRAIGENQAGMLALLHSLEAM